MTFLICFDPVAETGFHSHAFLCSDNTFNMFTVTEETVDTSRETEKCV